MEDKFNFSNSSSLQESSQPSRWSNSVAVGFLITNLFLPSAATADTGQEGTVEAHNISASVNASCEEGKVVINGSIFNLEDKYAVQAYPQIPGLADNSSEAVHVYQEDARIFLPYETGLNRIDADTAIEIKVRDASQQDAEYITARERTIPGGLVCSEENTGGGGSVPQEHISSNSYEATSVATAEYAFDFDLTDEVIIATTADFADALAASALAAESEAPILLNNPDTLHDEVRRLLQEKNINSVTIMGGENAISSTVSEEIEALGISVNRIAGASRIETAVLAAEKLEEITGEEPREVRLVNAYGYADAVSIANNAAEASPILSTGATELHPVTTEYLLENSSTITNVEIGGGTAVVSEEVAVAAGQIAQAAVERQAGPTRFKTNHATISNLIEEVRSQNSDPSMQPITNLYVVAGEHFPDAVAVSAVADKSNALLIVPPQEGATLDDIMDYIARELRDLEKVVFVQTVIGHPSEYSDNVRALVNIAVNAGASEEN